MPFCTAPCSTLPLRAPPASPVRTPPRTAAFSATSPAAPAEPNDAFQNRSLLRRQQPGTADQMRPLLPYRLLHSPKQPSIPLRTSPALPRSADRYPIPPHGTYQSQPLLPRYTTPILMLRFKPFLDRPFLPCRTLRCRSLTIRDAPSNNHRSCHSTHRRSYGPATLAVRPAKPR